MPFNCSIEDCRPVLAVAGLVAPGSTLLSATADTNTLLVLEELDIFFNGGTGGDLQWENPAGFHILDWRPGSTNQQSEHWSGFQCLAPGQRWSFFTSGSIGFEIVGWGWLVPYPTSVIP